MTAALVVVVVTLLLGGLLGHLHPPRRRRPCTAPAFAPVYVQCREPDQRPEFAPPLTLTVPANPTGLSGRAWRIETALLRRAARAGRLGLPVDKPSPLLAMATIGVMALAWFACSRRMEAVTHGR